MTSGSELAVLFREALSWERDLSSGLGLWGRGRAAAHSDTTTHTE